MTCSYRGGIKHQNLQNVWDSDDKTESILIKARFKKKENHEN